MSRSTFLRAAVAASLILVLPIGNAAMTPAEATAAQDGAVGPSGLPLPRFVSLKSGRVNSRIGPGVNYPVDWLYLKSGLPMEITQEFDTWRRVRDSDGSEGWINQSLLSGKRTGIAAPWQRGKESADPAARRTRQRCARHRRHRARRGRQDQPVQRRMVRDEFRRPHRMGEPVVGVGRVPRRIDQGLTRHQGCRVSRSRAATLPAIQSQQEFRRGALSVCGAGARRYRRWRFPCLPAAAAG